MKNLIEVTNHQNDKILININFIFRIEKLKSDRVVKTKIELTPSGYNNFPYQYVETVETYEEVKQLIEAAI